MSDILFPTDYDLTTAQRVGLLPIRGEKRIIPVDVGVTGEDDETAISAISNVKATLTDYVTVRLLNRKGENYVYRFLVNPKTISVAHQTLDSHSMTRAGWQFGVWGEDTIDLHISGSTAGQYHFNGTTDAFEEFSISYRNIMELMNLFENNGYTFEGDDLNSTNVFAADFTRRRIKYHQDVELKVGNFIWRGMFTTMSLSSTADTPYYNKFDLGFLAWKEDYKKESPWRSPIVNSVYRGHSKEVLDMLEAKAQQEAEYAADAAAKEESAKQSDAAIQNEILTQGIQQGIVDPRTAFGQTSYNNQTPLIADALVRMQLFGSEGNL
jgi:hypothetical protein